MGYGAVEFEPFTSMQAVLNIIDAKAVEGKFEETPLQVECEFLVVSYEEEDEDGGSWTGWKFKDWFGFSRDKKTGKIGISKSPKAKLFNLIKNTVGEAVIDNGAFEPEPLKGHQVRARVTRSGKNEDGDHSRIKAESIMPKPRRPKQDRDLEGIDVEDLDMGPEAPDFSDLRETG